MESLSSFWYAHETERVVTIFNYFAILIERVAEQDRLPKNVCLQTSYSQIQVVGSADQSGESHPWGQTDISLKIVIIIAQMYDLYVATPVLL